MYKAIQACYSVTLNAVRINGEIGCWFNTYQGVKQGDVLSPSLFSAYIDTLIRELSNSGIGVKLIDQILSVLAYADDLVLVAPTQAGLQRLMNITED